MAYSRNPITCQKMLPYLEPLAQGEEADWQVAPNRSHWFAYKIREALFVADQHPELFPELRSSDWEVRVTGSRQVEARRRASQEAEVLEVARPPSEVFAAPEVQSVEQLVMEWQRQGRRAGKLYFPNVNLSTEDLLKLWHWAEEEVLIFENVGAITLLPKAGNEDAAPYAWNPSEVPG